MAHARVTQIARAPRDTRDGEALELAQCGAVQNNILLAARKSWFALLNLEGQTFEKLKLRPIILLTVCCKDEVRHGAQITQ